jgi:hypothetical protein
MMSTSYKTPTVRLLLLIPALMLASGCAVLKQDVGDSAKLPLASAEPGPQAGQSARGTITLEVRAAGEKPEVGQVTLREAMHVQDVLEQTKLVERFSRMDLHVLRVQGDQRQKMESKYRHEHGHVDLLYDYLLYPGDHLVVVEDTSNIIDDMLGSVSGPLGRAFR